MAKGIQGYNEAQATTFAERPKLPVGGYVVQISNVREEEYNWGSVIIMAFDICEGEFAGFYKNDYKLQPDEDKKWKGTYRLNIPLQKSSSQEDMDKFKKALGFYKGQLQVIQESNSGLVINAEKDWNVAILKNQKVGIIFNEKEWEFKGKTGFFTNPCRLTTCEKIRSGDFKIPEPILLKNKSILNPVANNTSDFELTDGDVPL